jgi:hypothetical protein
MVHGQYRIGMPDCTSIDRDMRLSNEFRRSTSPLRAGEYGSERTDLVPF